MVSQIDSPSSNGDAIVAKLARERQDLLDLGLRNTLINYRLLRSRGVDVTDEIPAEIYRILVHESKNLSFAAAGDGNGNGRLAQPADQPTGDLAHRHTDRKLQTGVSSAELQKRLLNTYYQARTLLEEQGVSVLFLALGMLEWFESDQSDISRHAPLVLVPVELERSNAMDRFHVLYAGDDIGENLSLVAKLTQDFAVKAPPFPEFEELELDRYFDAWEEAIHGRQRWRVNRTAISMGFFSFGKFLMYRDLDPATWPGTNQPSENNLIQSLLGEGFLDSAPLHDEDTSIDQLIDLRKVHQVVDADSSQTIAILEANSGRHLVIQGPPGTGKSQTITNIVAEAIGAGKTVLFVSEKMAALEVVKRRLDQVGIGDACLELHSHKTNKRSVLGELRRTLELGKPRAEDLRAEIELLGDARQQLNAYSAAVNLPVGNTGASPYLAYGQVLEIRSAVNDLVWPRVDLPGIVEWSEVDYRRREAMVDELQARVAAMGIPNEHPFWGSRRSVLLPVDRERIARALSAALTSLADLRAEAGAVATIIQTSSPTDQATTKQLESASKEALATPPVRAVSVNLDTWSEERDVVTELLSAGERYAEIRQLHENTLIPEAWDQDVLKIRQDLAGYQEKWWRVFSGTFRSARNSLRGLCAADAPDALEDQIQLSDDILESQRQAARIGEFSALGERLFGRAWKGPESDWPALTAQAEWALQVRDRVSAGELPSEILAYLDDQQDSTVLAEPTERLSSALVHYERAITELVDALAFDTDRAGWGSAGLIGQPFEIQRDWLETWTRDLDSLHEIAAFNMSAERCHGEELGVIAQLAESWPEAGLHLTNSFQKVRGESIIAKAMNERSALRQFDYAGHDSLVNRFRELDQRALDFNRRRLAFEHWNHLPRHAGGGQLATLRREFEKKTRHLPIRRLMADAGNAIQAIKPVFMMSPMSIAMFIPPGSVTFDLVIFDEASQVKPIDAFGALLRGKQAVVVGDSKQLPPTTFFDALTNGDEPEEDQAETADLESVLGLFSAKNALQRMLRWHYRSRHESLIAVSNQEFYDNRLVIFPSPDAGREATGLIYHHLPDAFYDRGRSRANPNEAREVAYRVIQHARNSPDLTLGVAAFSVAQTDAVLDAVEQLRRENPDCEAFFSGHQNEPFFVKNLENVQGDERDVIFISIGYGKDENGVLAMNFGPLNRQGGERRLNVLITRARLRCEVFTNLSADDIDLNRSNAVGVAALKRFLHYAATGHLEIPEVSDRPSGSPFEDSVHRALTEAGYIVHGQVGTAGFFIDLAVVDPDKPGRYVLGIECDGATYHSARSARDRDRLRQQVLEGLGWSIHRIWSTDWFRNPDQELRRTVVAIEAARAAGNLNRSNPTSFVAETIEREPDRTLDDVPSNQLSDKYQLASIHWQAGSQPLHEVPPATLANYVVRVVGVESPVHEDEVSRRIMDTAGVGRLGSRIKNNFTDAIRVAERSGKVVRRGKFLWVPGNVDIHPRDRSDQSGFTRTLEAIAPEEIAAAIQLVVESSYGIDRHDVAAAAGRLLGFQRVPNGMRESINIVVEGLVAEGRLTDERGFLTITT